MVSRRPDSSRPPLTGYRVDFVLCDYLESMPGRRDVGDMGEEETDGCRFVDGPVRWLTFRILVADGEIDQGLNKLLESGIGGVPVARPGSSEVEALEGAKEPSGLRRYDNGDG